MNSNREINRKHTGKREGKGVTDIFLSGALGLLFLREVLMKIILTETTIAVYYCTEIILRIRSKCQPHCQIPAPTRNCNSSVGESQVKYHPLITV